MSHTKYAISTLKQQTQLLVNNIQNLQDLPTAATAPKLIADTFALLNKLPTKRILNKCAKTIKKRQQRRQRQKQKRKLNAAIAAKIKARLNQSTKDSTSCPNAQAAVAKSATKIASSRTQNPGLALQRAREHSDAQRYLKIFNLLEQLHFARSADQQHTQKLRDELAELRTGWQQQLHTTTSKRSTAAQRLEDQWNEVFFGVGAQKYSAQLDNIMGRGTERERLQEFLRKRRTWDSYLVHSKKYGSYIPTGWVLPPEQCNAAWVEYKMEPSE